MGVNMSAQFLSAYCVCCILIEKCCPVMQVLAIWTLVCYDTHYKLLAFAIHPDQLSDDVFLTYRMSMETRSDSKHHIIHYLVFHGTIDFSINSRVSVVS